MGFSKKHTGVWSNNKENSAFKAFFSALTLDHDHHWQHTDKPEDAELWCLVDFHNNLNELISLYNRRKQSPYGLPRVVFLGHRFEEPPVKGWVFFKQPVNVTALHNWLHTQTLKDTLYIPDALEQLEREEKTDDPLIDKLQGFNSRQNHSTNQFQNENHSESQRWKAEAFRLKYWPNVTQYSTSPEVVDLCSILLRDWTRLDELPNYQLQGQVIASILNDAEREGNLIYATKEQATTAKQSEYKNNRDKKSSKGSGWRFFKDLINKLVGS